MAKVLKTKQYIKQQRKRKIERLFKLKNNN